MPGGCHHQLRQQALPHLLRDHGHVWQQASARTRHAKLISLVARIQHPGVGVDGKYDVDGLRSQAVAFARRTVGAGVWRANYMTISLWASRTYGAAAPVGR